MPNPPPASPGPAAPPEAGARTLVYEFGQGERGQGIGQALFSGIPFCYALARESGRELKLRVEAGGRPLESYLGDRTGWSRDLPPRGTGPVLEFWTFGSTMPVEDIEAAAHSDAPTITVRGNDLRARDHAIRGSYFAELFDLRVRREFEPDAVIHLRAGDLHAFGRGTFRDRDIREAVWMSGGLEQAAGHALRLARSLVRDRGGPDRPLIMFLSDSPRARRWAIRQSQFGRVVTTSLEVNHSYQGSGEDLDLLWTDLSYMITAPILVYTAGAFSQFAAAVNPGHCVRLEPHIPEPRARPWYEVRWAGFWSSLRRHLVR